MSVREPRTNYYTPPERRQSAAELYGRREEPPANYYVPNQTIGAQIAEVRATIEGALRRLEELEARAAEAGQIERSIAPHRDRENRYG